MTTVDPAKRLKALLKKQKLDPNPRRAIWEIITRGDLKLLQEVEALGAPVRGEGADASLIASAASAGHLEIVEYLAAGGASIRVTDRTNKPAFELLLNAEPSKEALQVLLEHGYDPNEAGKWGYLGLQSALRHEHKELFDALVAAGADVNGTPESRPLSWCKSAVSLDWLLSAGADPSLPEPRSGSLLHEWTLKDDAAAIARLLEAGATVTENAAGWTPPTLAADRAAPRAAALAAFAAAGLSPSGIVDSRLPAAIVAKDDAAVAALLAEGHVDAVDADNTSALVHALILGKVELARTLLDAGASAALVDRRGRCALGESLPYAALFERLLAAGPSDECLAAAMLTACTKLHPSGLKRLLEAGAKATTEAIERVCIATHVYNSNKDDAGACAALLLEAGADAARVDPEHIAAARRKGHTQLLKVLESAAGSPVDYSAAGSLDAKAMRAFWLEVGHPSVDWGAAAKQVRGPHLRFLVEHRDVDALARLLAAGVPGRGLWQAVQRNPSSGGARVLAFLAEHIPHEPEIMQALLSTALLVRGCPPTPQYKLVERLLALGAKAEPEGGRRPLASISANTDLASLQRLVDAGATATADDFVRACQTYRVDLARLLWGSGDIDLEASVSLPGKPLDTVRGHVLSLPKKQTGHRKRAASEILLMVGI